MTQPVPKNRYYLHTVQYRDHIYDENFDPSYTCEIDSFHATVGEARRKADDVMNYGDGVSFQIFEVHLEPVTPVHYRTRYHDIAAIQDAIDRHKSTLADDGERVCAHHEATAELARLRPMLAALSLTEGTPE